MHFSKAYTLSKRRGAKPVADINSPFSFRERRRSSTRILRPFSSRLTLLENAAP